MCVFFVVVLKWNESYKERNSLTIIASSSSFVLLGKSESFNCNNNNNYSLKFTFGTIPFSTLFRLSLMGMSLPVHLIINLAHTWSV